MATQGEDPASVLEQFIHDAANLPAEINYMMEEIQAKDKEMQKFLATISAKDSTLQKHVKANTGMQPHPKEAEINDIVKKSYDSCLELQTQKITLSEKACAMLERQVKRLDMRIRELQSDGQLLDGPPLPSVFNKKPEAPRNFIDMPTAALPLQTASINALNATAHRMSPQVTATMRQAQQRQLSQLVTASVPSQRSSAPATPASAVLQQQRQQDREVSAGADTKRRKLTAPTGILNMPAQPSSLRQTSLGPGTPKAGTPTGSSRAGSIPRTLSQVGVATKKVGMKKGPTHPALNKIRGARPNKHNRLSSGRRKNQSPSVRGGRGATVASEEDSVLSSGDPSDTDASQSRSKRNNKKMPNEDTEMVDEEDVEDEGDEDDRRYCTCNQRSYGEMVACENDDCPYQWFHTGCLNMKKVPDEDEDWYCPTCRQKPEIIEKIKAKQKKQKK